MGQFKRWFEHCYEVLSCYNDESGKGLFAVDMTGDATGELLFTNTAQDMRRSSSQAAEHMAKCFINIRC